MSTIPDDKWKEYLIDGIMPAREVHLLAGPPGAGKTTLLLQMIKDFLAGDPVLGGHKTYPGPVFYLSCDRSANEHKRVLHRIGLDPSAFPMAVLDDIFHHSVAPNIEGVMAYVKKIAPFTKLLVIDGYATLTPEGKHSDYGTVSTFVRKCGYYCRTQNMTILGVVHYAKEKGTDGGYANPRDRILGSTAWAGFANTILALEREDPNDDKNLIRVFWILARNAPEQKMKLRMDVDGMLQTVEEYEEDALASLLEVEMSKLSLDKEFQRKEFIQMGAMIEPPISSASVDRLLKKLLANGVWEKGLKFGRYRRVSTT